MDLNDYLTTKDVADQKGVTTEAVRQAVKSGALKPVRTIRPFLFSPRDVEQWIPYAALMRRAARARQTEKQE